MTEPRWLNANERRAWLAQLSINTMLPAALDTQLHAAAGQQVQARDLLGQHDGVALHHHDAAAGAVGAGALGAVERDPRAGERRASSRPRAQAQ